jgi:hypothetical protein
MENKVLRYNGKTLLKAVLIIVVLFLTLMIIEQISVSQTLNGDGKVHHAIIRPADK